MEAMIWAHPDSGCVTEDGHEMNPGERYVKDKIVHECVGKSNGVMWYGWKTCGIVGAPPCNDKPSSKSVSAKATMHKNPQTEYPLLPVLVTRFYGKNVKFQKNATTLF